MKKNGYGKILKDGIITQNPVLVQVLGMCPTLAVSTQLMNGLGMGAAVTAVLICSNLFISLLRRVIDKRIRIASFIVIIAGFVTMVEMLMKAYLPSLSASLGVYIPLIVVNCIILARAEAFASRNKPLPSVADGFACGIGFTAAICIVSAIREILGTGALLGYDFKLIPPIMIFTLAPGGLLVLGFVMAFCAWISNRRKRRAAAPVGTADEGGAATAAKAEAPQEPAAPVKPAAPEAAEKKETPAPEPAAFKPTIAESILQSEAAKEFEPKPEPVAEEAGDSPPAEPARNDEVAADVEVTAEPDTSSAPAGHLPLEGKASEPAAEPESAPEPDKPAPAQMTFAAVEEAETAPAPEESAPVEKPEPVTFDSEEEHDAALAAAIRYFGGFDGETAEPETPAAPVILSEAAEAAEPKDPLPVEEAAETAGDSPTAEPTRNDAAAETPDAPEPKRRSFFSRRKADADDPLEVPSFMSEPVTLMRGKPEKEEIDNG